MNIRNLFFRIGFALKYKTLKPCVIQPGKDDKILVFHNDNQLVMSRRCPHQGAGLKNGGLKMTNSSVRGMDVNFPREITNQHLPVTINESKYYA